MARTIGDGRQPRVESREAAWRPRVAWRSEEPEMSHMRRVETMPSIKCGRGSMASAEKGSIATRRRHSNLPLMPMAMRLVVVLAWLGVCCGFQAVGYRPPSAGREKSLAPSSNAHIIESEPSYSRRGRPLLAIRPRCESNIGEIRRRVDCVGGGELFPRRTAPRRGGWTTALAAADDNASDDPSKQVSDENPLLVRAWLSLRKLVARLWAILLRPFRLLKAVLGKIGKGEKDDEATAGAEGTAAEEKPVQEEVVITEIENIAAVEEDGEEVANVTSDVADVVKDATAEQETAQQQEEEEEDGAKDDAVEATGSSEATTAVTAIIAAAAEPDFSDDATTATPRQATSHANVDLTGNWTLIVDDAFTSQYDEYLRRLGQPALVRTVALTVIGSTREETLQTDDGARLFIRGMNVRGSWERTLEASERTVAEGELDGDGSPKHAVEGHALRPMTTADGEDVEVASWWESNGAVHRSWVVGGMKYGGGDFENRRYLTDNGNILVCESTFHPDEEGREEAGVTWRFLREGAIYGDKALQIPNPLDFLKKDEENEEDDAHESGIIVGDIMDDVVPDAEAAAFLPATANLDEAHDAIEEAIERGGWVPPVGDRWALAAPGVDLTGRWKLIITEKFKKDYDAFLESLGQPLIVRGAAVVLVPNTREETSQTDGGRSLHVKGINAKGVWERTLASSGSDYDNDGVYDRVEVKIVTADAEPVTAESWWEADGTRHVSWTYGVTRYGGGSFESKRYLEEDGNVYVCDSTFHPNDKSRGASYLKWKFLREGAAFMLDEE